MNRATDIAVSVIAVAIVTTLVTRPGAAETLKTVTQYLSNAIRAMLGTGGSETLPPSR